MPPDKAARRRIHDALCVREQGTRNMPAAPYFEGIAAGGSQEAIYVLFRGNIVAGMKICRNPPGVPDGYRIGQTDTQSLRDTPDGNRRGQLLRAVRRDRAAEHAGMNAAVRAPASGDVTRESAQIGRSPAPDSRKTPARQRICTATAFAPSLSPTSAGYRVVFVRGRDSIAFLRRSVKDSAKIKLAARTEKRIKMGRDYSRSIFIRYCVFSYSVRSATTGSFLAAPSEGISPASVVSSMLTMTSTNPPTKGREAVRMGIPVT